MRVHISEDPYRSAPDTKHDGHWPCKWVACEDGGPGAFVAAYRLKFDLAASTTVRAHVSADERYELYVDGARVARGSERGDAENWFFETYDIVFQPGTHVIVARVCFLGSAAAYAQMSVEHGFLFSPQEPEHIALFGTGVAAWEAKRLGGYEFVSPDTAWGTGANLVIHGSRFDWGFERGEGEGWRPVRAGWWGVNPARCNDYPPIHLTRPAVLPTMLEAPWHGSQVRHVAALPAPEANADKIETHAQPIRVADSLPDEVVLWQRLLDGEAPLTIPAHTRRRVLLDATDYVCAYPELRVSSGAGATVRVHWQESLYNDLRSNFKGNRDEIEGKYFVACWWPHDGVGDTFLPDGGARRVFDTLWWQCGRYIEIVVVTAADPLVIEGLVLRETRYPLALESEFAASDARLAEVTPIMLRVLQMCSHETYMDCPYYEQIQYIGDTRLQALVTYAVTADTRLARKAIELLEASRLGNGMTQSRYPSRVVQTTAPFSLWWIAMVRDFALWRDDDAFVRARLPGVRGVLDGVRAFLNHDGLLEFPLGGCGNFMDWVTTWKNGASPGEGNGTSLTGVQNWQHALILGQAAELEDWYGEPEMAARYRRQAAECAQATSDAFWNEERGMYADDLQQRHFSEHAQCLAILSGQLAPERRGRVASGLLNAPDLARTTIYFAHYLFETLYALGTLEETFMRRMQLWFDLKKSGLRTTVEMPEPSRSDCHAWGAHPLHHYFASVLGVRPAAPGFATVRIAPQLGRLASARGKVPHPRGEIAVDFRNEGGTLSGTVVLPEGVTGTLVCGSSAPVALHGGRQSIAG